jgi:hypothetical protein
MASATDILGRPRAQSQEEVDRDLSDFMGELFDDPLSFATSAYAWGVGELAAFPGPDDWQAGWLRELGQAIRKNRFDGSKAVMPVQMSTVSGHGVGKTALVGIVADFIRSTRPGSHGRVTANTGAQLSSTTWAEIRKWGVRSITGHWFDFQARQIVAHSDKKWRLDAIVWDDKAPEAFAGLHAAQSSPYYILDEASRIPRIIAETAQGALTDGEPFFFMFGNGTRNSGYFYESHVGKGRENWHRFKVDSRKARVSNKELLDKWIDEYGIESDYCRIRILGDFPKQSAEQFIGSGVVAAARKAPAEASLYDPLIFGVDVARYGDDNSMIVIRKGRDARTHKAIKFLEGDTMALATKIAELAEELRPDAIFVDGGGVGGPVVDRLNQLRVQNVIEVNFGHKGDGKYFNKAAIMWGGMRDWLRAGGAIEDHDDLQNELTTREYFFSIDNRIQLESKDDLKSRGEHSPDWADALCLTFAHPVGPRDPRNDDKHVRSPAGFGVEAVVGADYDPFA